jgi:type II secretory pathway predicted ATPase ExeA
MNEDLGYIAYFNLVARPFDDICGPRFIWLGAKQLENLAYLKVGVEGRKGILLLIGEEGSGKSVLVDRLLPIIAGDLKTVFIRHPGLEPSQLFDVLIEDLGLDKSIATKGDFLSHFREFLKGAHSAGKKVLLIVENVESQEDEILEQLRLFSNFEEDGNKLLSILLVGTTKLVERIKDEKHRALFQRCAERRWVEPLDVAETGAYIRHRLMVAGSFLEIFSLQAIRVVHTFSGGLPKLINLICDHALMRGCHEGLRTIDERVLTTYVKEVRKALGAGEDLSLLVKNRSKSQPKDTSVRKSFVARGLPTAIVLAVLLLAAGVLRMDFEQKGPPVEPLPFVPVHIYFDPGTADLPANASADLDRIADYLSRAPAEHIAIKGYSDSRGTPSQNVKISKMRAEAVKAYLVRKGVDAAKIQAVGIGSEPAASAGASAESQKQNRRVEIELVTAGAK